MSNDTKSGNYTCFRCKREIHFTSKQAQTPSGKPTKDPSTGKVIPLDPSTNDYHECKPEDVKEYRETEEYKTRVSAWIAKQQDSLNTVIHDTSSNHETINNKSNVNLTFEKILTRLDRMTTDIAHIKNALKIGADKSASTTDTYDNMLSLEED